MVVVEAVGVVVVRPPPHPLRPRLASHPPHPLPAAGRRLPPRVVVPAPHAACARGLCGEPVVVRAPVHMEGVEGRTRGPSTLHRPDGWSRSHPTGTLPLLYRKSLTSLKLCTIVSSTRANRCCCSCLLHPHHPCTAHAQKCTHILLHSSSRRAQRRLAPLQRSLPTQHKHHPHHSTIPPPPRPTVNQSPSQDPCPPPWWW